MKKTLLILCFLLLPSAGSAMSLSPSVMEMNLEPGESGQYLLELYNETDQDIYLSGSIEIFKPKNEQGQAEIMSPDVSHQAVTWLKLPVNSLALSPGDRLETPVLIDVPKTADAGGYYLAIVWETSGGPKSDTNQVQVTSRLASLLLLAVGGEVKEELAITNFKLQAEATTYNHLPINFEVRLKNQGNVHTSPGGLLVIRNMFGKVTQTVPFNDQQARVLPNSIRRYEIGWPQPEAEKFTWLQSYLPGLFNELNQLAFGKYTAQLQIEYGQDKLRVETEEIHFWIVTWRSISFVLVIIVLIMMLKILLVRLKRIKHV